MQVTARSHSYPLLYLHNHLDVTGITDNIFKLHIKIFVPQGCHRLLYIPNHIEGSTQCDLKESKLRTFVLPNLLFVVHVIGVMAIIVTVYDLIVEVLRIRKHKGYEPLDNSNHRDWYHCCEGF